jgi:hypothetical protein
VVDGIDTSTFKRGEVYELTSLAANVLIAEGIAMPEMRRSERRQFSGALPSCLAHDRRARRRRS